MKTTTQPTTDAKKAGGYMTKASMPVAVFVASLAKGGK
jgi:hypothetical protein